MCEAGYSCTGAFFTRATKTFVQRSPTPPTCIKLYFFMKVSETWRTVIMYILDEGGFGRSSDNHTSLRQDKEVGSRAWEAAYFAHAPTRRVHEVN